MFLYNIFMGCDGFFREVVGEKYLLHLPCVYEGKYLGVLPQVLLHVHLLEFDM